MKRHRTPAAASLLKPQYIHSNTTRAKYVSFALGVTAVYGDLLKRVLPGTVALVSLYAISVTIILFMLATGRRSQRFRLRTPAVSRLAALLMATYYIQFCLGLEVDLLPAMMMLMYVCVPLAIIVVIPCAYPEFDIHALALQTTILMVPIHAVGAVQAFIDPQFLVSTAYSETGGVIARNFLDGTDTFNRLPSLFASADRYAGVSAMQVFLTFLLFSEQALRTKRAMLWLTFSLLLAFAGLFFAGARSRILIVAAALLVAGIALLVSVQRGRLTTFGRTILVRAVMVIGLLLTVGLSFESVRHRIAELPIFAMLEQTAEQGDAQDRTQQAIDISMVPDDVKFFGEGLGKSGDGRPGEFGIRAMWIEGGFFWTIIMLMIHAGILLSIVMEAIRSTLGGNAVLSLMLTAGGLFWLFGLLAGLSSSFELSVALLLCPMIAVAAMATSWPMTGGRLERGNPEARGTR